MVVVLAVSDTVVGGGGGGGEVVTVIDRDGLTVDITQLSRPWDAAVVEDVFEILDEREPTGHVVAVFDPATGAPTELWLDPYPTAIDDEEQYTLTVERL